jgi:hypothetical protein
MTGGKSGQAEEADLVRRLAAAAGMPEDSPGPVMEGHDVDHRTSRTHSSSLRSVD